MRSTRPRPVWVLALALALALARPARAADRCQVTVEGPDSAAWQASADELNTALRTERIASTCTRVVLHAVDGRARLTFTTGDGRSAERLIEAPLELVPTVQALSVLVPTPDPGPPPPVESKRAAPAEPRARVPSKRAGRPAVSASRSRDSERPDDAEHPNPYALSPMIGAQVGLRGGANRLISPTVTASIALSIDRWELGLVGRYEAHYVVTTGGNEDRPDTAGLVLGPTFGFRKSIGPYVLRGGGMLLLAALYEDGGAKAGRAEGRVGFYTGGVFPRASTTRFRVDLGVDFVPYNIGKSEQNADGEWSLPWWAVTFALGLEFG